MQTNEQLSRIKIHHNKSNNSHKTKPIVTIIIIIVSDIIIHIITVIIVVFMTGRKDESFNPCRGAPVRFKIQHVKVQNF